MYSSVTSDSLISRIRLYDVYMIRTHTDKNYTNEGVTTDAATGYIFFRAGWF